MLLAIGRALLLVVILRMVYLHDSESINSVGVGSYCKRKSVLIAVGLCGYRTDP